MVTHIFGDAWKRLGEARYNRLRCDSFLLTGLLQTLSGVNDRCVYVQSHDVAIKLLAPEVPWDNEAENLEYEALAWNGHPNFVTSKCKKTDPAPALEDAAVPLAIEMDEELASNSSTSSGSQEDDELGSDPEMVAFAAKSSSSSSSSSCES